MQNDGSQDMTPTVLVGGWRSLTSQRRLPRSDLRRAPLRLGRAPFLDVAACWRAVAKHALPVSPCGTQRTSHYTISSTRAALLVDSPSHFATRGHLGSPGR